MTGRKNVGLTTGGNADLTILFELPEGWAPPIGAASKLLALLLAERDRRNREERAA
jgi:hypothetical protein